MIAAIVPAAIAVVAAIWTFGRPHVLTTSTTPTVDAISRQGDVAVVIPARNEAATIGIVLGSIAAGTMQPSQVIVVDDHSDDETAAVARAVGATVIHAPPLPNGWTGKSWACHNGALSATTPRLLFLDADTSLSVDGLAALVDAHDRSGGLVSVQPYHDTGRWYEELSAIFNCVSLMSSGAFALRSTGASDLAFGPCLLTSAQDYQRVGGHAAVRASIIEDVDLAARYRAAGLPVHCWLGKDRIRFRMYPDGLRSLTQGWTKNIAAGATATRDARVIPVVVWVAALVDVATATVVGVVHWIAGSGPPVGPLAACAVVAVHLRLMLRRIGSFRPITAAFFVVPLTFFVAVFVRSASSMVFRRPVRWKGRLLDVRPTEGL